jgi:regulator of cell morphogenesis and NO signaling
MTTNANQNTGPRGSGGAPDSNAGLDCSLTVNAVRARHPSTLEVFNRYGLDTCCGGRLSVSDAAHAAGVDAKALCAALTDAIAAPA